MTDKTATTQILASSIAAIGAAYIGSRFGLTGTTLGAGVASLVTMGGTTLTQRSLERTHKAAAARLRARRASSKALALAPTVPIRITDLPPARPPAPAPPQRRLTWKWTAAGAAGVFVITLIVLTVVELGLGHPLSGGNQGTTLTGLVGGPTTHHAPAPTPSPTRFTSPSTPAATRTFLPLLSSTSAPAPTTTQQSPVTPTITSAPVTTTVTIPPITTVAPTPISR